MKKNYPPKGEFYMYPQYDEEDNLVGFTTDYEGEGAFGKHCKIIATGETFLGTLEVKERDLNEEIESYFKGFGKFPSVGIDDCIDIAKHFFEFGLKSKSSYVSIPNIDDTLKEMGVDPDSKSAKSFKESYYMALEKFKAQKGE